MKLLTKILLINWHMFTVTEIEVNHNMLITGHNGAGKSTLLDAVQYVLTGGRHKFNLAANEDGKRRLEGYVRGRLGTEGQENLREGDVATHIALQFYDEGEQRNFILGAVIDLPEGGSCREHFYIAYRTLAERVLFLNIDNEVMSKSRFERHLKSQNVKYEFAQNKSDARNMVNRTLGLHSKYSDLIPRALAFRPIGDLNEFMYRFLLPDDQINIESLRENILLYRHFENTLEEQQGRLEILEKIMNGVDRIHDLNDSLSIVSLLKIRIFLEESEERLQALEEKKEESKRRLRLHESAEQEGQRQLKDIDRQMGEIKAQMSSLDANGLITTLTERVKNYHDQFEKSKQWLHNTYRELKADVSVLQQLGIDVAIGLDESAVIGDSSYADDLFNARRKTEELKNINAERGFKINAEKVGTQEELDKTYGEIRQLEQKHYPYRDNVRALINLLTEELSKSVGKTVTVRPFCEYLEITDETWRNAVEGYLNTQRFDLFVAPEYFRQAARIYERFKESRGIFDVGLVDTGKLSDYSEIPEGTLAEKVTTENIYARQYANLILGRVDCEESVELINRHKQAITPTCMVYRNYTVRAINPAVYKRPFIGMRAIELQLETARVKMEELRRDLQNIERRERENRLHKDLLGKLKFSYVDAFAENQQAYNSTRDDLDSSRRQLEELQNTPAWIGLHQQNDALEKERSVIADKIYAEQNGAAQKREEIRQCEEEQDTLAGAVKTARTQQLADHEKYADLLGRTDKEYVKLRRAARGEYSRMRHRNELHEQDYLDRQKQVATEITDAMHEYNLRTGYGYEEKMASVPVYQEQYDKLRNIEIERIRSQTIEARQKCETSFQEDFISTLRSKIELAKQNLVQLNRSLEDKSFQGDHYAFVVTPAKDKTFAQYYKILCSNEDYQRENIFMEELSEHNRQLMDELFEKLVITDNNEKNERLLRDYTDYRKYMEYDIRITHADGDVTMFSKVSREKSGGETQTPFYVIIAASFDQLTNTRKKGDSGCLVLFDEAFNNMDENRIEALMQFYQSLNIQLMIAVPEGRVRNIMPYTETALLLVKKNNRILNKVMIHEA